MSAPPLLAVEGMSLDFRTRDGRVKALDGISFEVQRGEILGIVGESGSGKSVSAYAIMDLLDDNAELGAARLDFAGADLLAGDRSALRGMRGREISMIFQSPRTALNPIRPVGKQIEDVLVRHGPVPRRQAKEKAIAALRKVRIPDPERRYDAYPFELSGGMCQRVMIAMALACEPMLLIADEPTTGLDVTTQAVILDLVRDLVDHSRMAAILITHDLGLAGEYCDRVVVMHAGHVVETAPVADLLARPAHPYSARLIAATPSSASSVDGLASIPGNLPNLLRDDLPLCRFRERCDRAIARCDSDPLPATEVAPGHLVRCWRPL
ncbi:ABC transporter ATP-binding protein [Prosthecomicrobium pneumaticum]|uniref:Peptide/nickel transport system ATP-binding protein n=1 Tax=Prosthecomicrobium pneumaticum TaxID=81895 RepID=A0A7W9L1N9_9HYPH|nr:ABC transporter ATP-binding protein [Prosthecomicrobium pneumaticum]MBB5752889.1 peptide/nickel transport system ATP-binding protein [Prosthecomicrobium pneumaticum]